jgi:hypothetical protein
VGFVNIVKLGQASFFMYFSFPRQSPFHQCPRVEYNWSIRDASGKGLGLTALFLHFYPYLVISCTNKTRCPTYSLALWSSGKLGLHSDRCQFFSVICLLP